jgi:hypothetical protein
MAVKLSALRAGRSLPLGRFLVLTSVRSCVDLRTITWLERISQLKCSVTNMNRTRDLPACGIVPQPTTLPCTRTPCRGEENNPPPLTGIEVSAAVDTLISSEVYDKNVNIFLCLSTMCRRMEAKLHTSSTSGLDGGESRLHCPLAAMKQEPEKASEPVWAR